MLRFGWCGAELFWFRHQNLLSFGACSENEELGHRRIWTNFYTKIPCFGPTGAIFDAKPDLYYHVLI